MKKCDCNERYDVDIDSMIKFEAMKHFFENQEREGIFESVHVTKPFYIGYSKSNEKSNWFATKWYICKSCGCLWEFDYPDFPAEGFVRKVRLENYEEKG